MKKEVVRLNIPALNDYLYSVIYNAPITQRLMLPVKFRKVLKTELVAKNFIKRSSLDDKVQLLSHFCIKHFLVLSNETSVESENLRGILNKLIDDTKALTLRQIVDSGLYVTSNKQIMALLSLCADMIHSPVYKINMEYTRTSYNSKGWGKKLEEKENDIELREKEDISMAKTSLSVSSVLKRSIELFGLSTTQVEVLLYVSTKKNVYFSLNNIHNNFAGLYDKNHITIAARDLIHSGHLAEHPFNTWDCSITGSGLQAIMNYKLALQNVINYA